MKAAVAVVLILAVAGCEAREKKGTNQHLWADTELTTQLWRLCSTGDVEQLKTLLVDNPEAVHARSADGRGPLWWAAEHKHKAVTELLISNGCNPDETDVDGRTASQMGKPGLSDYAKEEMEEKQQKLDALDGTEDDEDEGEYGYDD